MTDQLYKTDTNSVLRFREEAAKNNFLSEQEGKPVYDTVLMCEVITPGQTASTLSVEVERVLNEAAGLDAQGNRKVKRTGHYERFKAQIEAYKGDSGEYLDDGTPIAQWAQIDRGTAETLRSQGIHTIEALAGVADSALGNLGTGARTLRDKAASWLTARQFGVSDAQTVSENVRLKERVAELEAENTELRAMLDAMKPAQEAKAEPTPEPAVV